MAAALGYRPVPHGGTSAMQARLCFHLQADSYDTDSLIKVLEQLAGFYAGQKVVLLWDACQPTGATRCAPIWISSATG